MIKFDKVLVASDFSEHSRVALTYGAEISKAFDAEVLLLHVVERPDLLSQLPPGGEGYFPPNLSEQQSQLAEQESQRWLADSQIKRGRILSASGTPFVEIVRCARDENVDLIVVGTHGRGPIAHIMLGSVAEKVVRHAPCPVLTVREGEHEFVLP
jgi:nucleotide-binding universal stress UspA family protein